MWRAVVNTVMSLRFAWNEGYFFFFLPHEELLPPEGRLQSVELTSRYGPFPTFFLSGYWFYLNVSCLVTHWKLIGCKDVPHKICRLLCAFAKLRNATISFCHVCPSVRIEQLLSHWTNFHQIWYLSIFRKYLEKIQVSLKSDKNNGYFGEDEYIYRSISLNSS